MAAIAALIAIGVVSLPMRDGNTAALGPLLLIIGVVSLPMRDGNIWGSIKETASDVVVSLPMRDGNLSPVKSSISSPGLLAYRMKHDHDMTVVQSALLAYL